MESGQDYCKVGSIIQYFFFSFFCYLFFFFHCTVFLCLSLAQFSVCIHTFSCICLSVCLTVSLSVSRAEEVLELHAFIPFRITSDILYIFLVFSTQCMPYLCALCSVLRVRIVCVAFFFPLFSVFGCYSVFWCVALSFIRYFLLSNIKMDMDLHYTESVG